MIARAWSADGSRGALYKRVAEVLEHSGGRAEQQAGPEQRHGRSRLAADERERARRERRMVVRTRAVLR